MNRRFLFHIIILSIVLALLAGKGSPALAQSTDAAFEYSNLLSSCREEVYAAYRNLHMNLGRFDLHERMSMPKSLKDLPTLQAIKRWRARDWETLLAEIDETQKSIVRDSLSRFDKTIVPSITALAEFCHKENWTQREGEAWSLLQSKDKLPANGKDFFRRFASVKPFGWLPKKKAEHYSNGDLPKGRSKWQPAAEANAKHSTWGKAWKLDSVHWRIKGDIDYQTLVRVQHMLEAEFDLFVTLFKDKIPLTIPKKRMRVYIFKNQEEYKKQFQRYTKKEAGQEGGRFNSATDRCYFFYYDNQGDLRREISFEHVCLHEASHMLFDQLIIQQQIGFAVSKAHFWIMEGLADYFGSVQVEGLHAYLPTPTRMQKSGRFARMQEMIKTERVTPLQEFIAYDQSKFYSGDDGGIDHYAQAAMLTVYLYEQYHDRVSEYIKRVLVDAKGNHTKFHAYFDEVKKVDSEFQQWLLSFGAK